MNNPEWLSNPQLLHVETAKVTDYLLNSQHPTGKSKAAFFKAVGFSDRNVGQFIAALRMHATQNRIASVIVHRYGVKTVIDCFMPTPSGNSYCIRCVWNDRQDGAPPKLVTAHPLQIATSATRVG